MNDESLLLSGWIQVKRYGPSALAALVMYVGIDQVLDVLQSALRSWIVVLVNLVIRQGFPARMPLVERGTMPWTFSAKTVAAGVIVVVVGMFIGLWVQARSQRQSAP